VFPGSPRNRLRRHKAIAFAETHYVGPSRFLFIAVVAGWESGSVTRFTRMSLAGYSLAGRSPPEPASASPAEKVLKGAR
jgi:hypothetical protein